MAVKESNLQTELVADGAIKIKANLMLMESRGNKLFPLYARFITKNGKAESRQRRNRVRSFGIFLPLVIVLFSPIITSITLISRVFFHKKTNQKINFYQHLTLANE